MIFPMFFCENAARFLWNWNVSNIHDPFYWWFDSILSPVSYTFSPPPFSPFFWKSNQVILPIACIVFTCFKCDIWRLTEFYPYALRSINIKSSRLRHLFGKYTSSLFICGKLLCAIILWKKWIECIRVVCNSSFPLAFRFDRMPFLEHVKSVLSSWRIISSLSLYRNERNTSANA